MILAQKDKMKLISDFMQNLKYIHSEIVVEEVPDELSLAISITGCPLACKGCHSSHTWKYAGEDLTVEVLENLIQKNKYISCILFYDGFHNEIELTKLFLYTKSKNLKVAFYTGLELENLSTDLKSLCDYLKVGQYKEELGGLTSTTTNQRMYKNGVDITHIFNNRFK